MFVVAVRLPVANWLLNCICKATLEASEDNKGLLVFTVFDTDVSPLNFRRDIF